MSPTLQVFRSRILHFVGDPATLGDAAYEYFEDGLLAIENGRIRELGPARELLPALTDAEIQHFPHHLILPGFIDTHVHYPQTEIIGAWGEQLLSWLNNYTFPTELKFADYDYAYSVANTFLNELLRNGTTTALVFATVHPASVDAFFTAARERGLRMIAGKVLMDRHAPEGLCDTAESGYRDSRDLIEKWHGVDRLQYAITPRFAPTSSDAQLRRAGELLAEYSDVYLHTHLAENQAEIGWVDELFPEENTYLEVYRKAGLLSRRSVFAHGIHLADHDCKHLASAGSAIAHCPTSNLFLGSGLIELERMREHGIHLGLGTDVGGGTSFSLFRTMDEAYKIQQLRGHNLDPFQALYMATLGGAVALDLADTIGSLAPGKEADFQILNLNATPLMTMRTQHCQSLRDLIFVLNTLGDDRLVERTYALGRCVHHQTPAPSPSSSPLKPLPPGDSF